MTEKKAKKKRKKKEDRSCFYNPVILSVDPGGDAGFCIWLDGVFDRWGTLSFEDVIGIFKMMNELTKQAKGPRPLLVIEQQFSGVDVRAARVITERRMRWQVCAELLGWGVVVIYPSEWQSRTIMPYRGQTTKDKSLAYVKDKMGTSAPVHDIADAYCIGAYWLQECSNQGNIPKQQSSER